jgi:hypothetical protein
MLSALRPRLAWFTKPKNLLLLDFIGAVVTALFTGLILTTIVPTGLPAWFLWTLSAIAAAFACFDLVAYCCRADACWPLATIGVLNLLYCISAMVACFIYLPVITIMGIIYFAIEGAIVIPLAVLEYAVARHCCHENGTNKPLGLLA